jgi:hypothetical protein
VITMQSQAPNLARRILAGAQLTGLAAVWLVALVPAAAVAGGIALVSAFKGPK